MSRISAFQGTWEENKRPYVVLAPDIYCAVQGQTTIKVCGECQRVVDVNKYVTGVSTEATVDSPPGGATINLSIPDTDVNDFYVEGNFVIVPMMEVEVFAKGYYTVGGLPQYYRIFWGVVVNISKSWSGGITSFSISCKDMLYWWEKTNVIINPAFIGSEGAACGYQLWGNKFAGENPYTIIISLAKESMGDFSITDGSFMSYKPETGIEAPVIGAYAQDIMAYWQLKFGNIWNSLVLYGTSGMAYTFEGQGLDVSPIKFANSIFRNEAAILSENKATSEFKIQPHEIAAFKMDFSKVADVQFFQNDTQTKLSVALTARDQIQYEFYCDTTGDIIFKPPFYNLNVIPNKPVSWINDFEIIDDNINDSEAEVVTHMTSSGNAFGGVVDYGLTDDITIPRTGVIDWHLLKRYGWRRQDFQCEWAGNPKKLFWFLIDMIDRVNAKRHNGTVTIPMRPEIRMGFPVWIPHYDSFYYVNGVSHSYTPGGQATTTLQLSAKRSKFIAPKNLGRVKRVPDKPADKTAPGSKQANDAPTNLKDIRDDQGVKRRDKYTYKIEFSGNVGQTAGLGDENMPNVDEPLIIRDPTTGKILGYPNVVMVYRTTYKDQSLVQQTSKQGNVAAHSKKPSPKKPTRYSYSQVIGEMTKFLRDERKTAIINRIRHHRYEAGMTNAGLYDYAVDEHGDFKEMALIPVTSVTWGAGTESPQNLSDVSGSASATPSPSTAGKSKGKASGGKENLPPTPASESDGFMGSGSPQEFKAKRDKEIQDKINAINLKLNGPKSSGKGKKSGGGGLREQKKIKFNEYKQAEADFEATVKKNHKGEQYQRLSQEQYNEEEKLKLAIVTTRWAEYNAISDQIAEEEAEIARLNSAKANFKLGDQINVSIRPVSDEFGFEVIGHNRYGRGVFIDRGQLRLKFNEIEANQLRVQFSASGGMLTETPSNLRLGLQPNTTPEAFERMQPEDWVTGASSAPSAPTYIGNEVTLTSVNTYSSAINHAIEANAQIGAIFVEADATRRAKTIWELQPTVSTGLDGVGFPKCSCKLSQFSWYSVLPKEFLQRVLSIPATTYTSSKIFVLKGFKYRDPLTGQEVPDEVIKFNRTLMPAPTKPDRKTKAPATQPVPTVVEEKRQSTIIAIYSDGVTTKEFVVPSKDVARQQIEETDSTTVDGKSIAIGEDFFDVLNEYLVNRFNERFTYNKEREDIDTGYDRNIEAAVTGATDYVDPDNVLGPSGGELFDRAAMGDPEAIEILKGQTNWDWTKSDKARQDYYATKDKALSDMDQAWYDLKWSLAHGGSPPPKNTQPQPLTPPPLSYDNVVNNQMAEVLPTNPTIYSAHTGDPSNLPASPPAPKK